ncbi:MAG: rRNA cytosine-C5-methylase, partial [Rhodospirillaceae bacterium]|nr:rRNA cytosine-C5-methylase [Rhodospirillaceae bacterium]
MTPAARVAAAIDILGLVDALGRPADRVVDRWYRGHRFAGSKDRVAINAMVYGVLRQRAKLAWIIEKCGDRQLVGPRLMVLAQLVLDRGEDQSCVKALFDSSRFGPPALEQHELDLLAAIWRCGAHPTGLPGWVEANCPEWLFHEVLGYLGDSTGAEFAAMQRRPPLDLRVNTLKATPEEAARALAEENVVAERCPHASTGLRIAGRASVLGTRAYREGLVEVQDEGSQVAAALVQAQPGQTVIDLCAGAGGKSLALAAALMNRGVIHACDVNG